MKLIGKIGMARKNQENGVGCDVISGQLTVLRDSYDKVKKILAIRLPKIQLGDLLRSEG
jgi:hypothetical protein